MGVGQSIQSNQLGDMITNSGKNLANCGSPAFQPQARQQQLPMNYSPNPQVPALQVIYVKVLSHSLFSVSIILLLSKTC